LGARSRSGQIKVLAKAFTVLEVLHHNSPEGVRLNKVAARVKLPKPTVFRILRTFEALGYVAFDSSSEAYSIAAKLKDLGHPSITSVLLRLARPTMVRLVAEYEQTVNLALIEGPRLVYKEMLEGLRAVRMQPIPGVYLSPEKTALGKSILAYLPRERALSMLASSRTSRPRNSPQALLDSLSRQLQDVRRLGFAVDEEESERGLCCVGAPVFDKTGEPIASISISGGTGQLTPEVIYRAGRRLKHECFEISFALGYLPALPGSSGKTVECRD
jgi:IclR family acetate operon transcriptional repressor